MKHSSNSSILIILLGVIHIANGTIVQIKDCVDNCAEKEDGDYMSCSSCQVFATCSNGELHDDRPCGTCTDKGCPLEFDAGLDRCVYAGNSTTCEYVTLCLSENGQVITKTRGISLLKNIVIGDEIFDGNSFTKVLTIEHGPKQSMRQLLLSNIDDVSDNKSVTMTSNHLLYDANDELVQSKDIKIGDIIYNNYIVKDIKFDSQYSSSPITFSGFLQVNGIKVSSYVIGKEFATACHNSIWSKILRWLSTNINEQIVGEVAELCFADFSLLIQMFGEESMNNQMYINCISAIGIPIMLIKNISLTIPSIIPLTIVAIIIYKSFKKKNKKIIN